MTTGQLWKPSEYAPFASGSGAVKLAASGVAPLVVAARGIRTITPDDVKGFLAMLGIRGADSRKQKVQIAAAVGQTDALFMPWYTAERVIEMQRDHVHLPPQSTQLRPDPINVKLDARGKGAKYQQLADSNAIIGPHPATPTEWLTNRGRAHLFTEGMIKADSALTAMLLHAGVTRDDLSLQVSDIAPQDSFEQTVAARDRLVELMRSIPDDDQVIIYGFVSVTTWRNNPEWKSVDLKGVDCYVAFDGDTATNPKVWRQAKDLWSFLEYRKSNPKLIDMSQQTLPNGDKCGMDDYLAEVGDWPSLLKLATPNLPAKPETADLNPGDWRMDPKTLTTEEFKAGRDDDDPGSWALRHEFVARVAVVEDRRQVLDIERATGRYHPRTDARDMDSRVDIEVEWFDDGKDKQSAIVRGPHDLLMAPPSEWRRIPGAAVPSNVAMLETWPPRDPNFLRAMKAYRRDEVQVRPLWNHMGWVPTVDDVPVFIVGEQVIGRDGEMPDAASSAVTDIEVRSASRFGVRLPMDDDEARDAIRRTLQHYRPDDPRLGPWRDQRHATVVIAAALRPCAPKPCRVPVLLSGTSGGGKSYTSAAIMMFWQRDPGTWTDRSLPGSANDTYATNEVAISRTPLWVVDDLAPSGEDGAQASRKTTAVTELIRNVHNNTSRGRRTSDMRAQERYDPRALLVVSAEQAPEDQPSIMNRLIHIKVRGGEFLSESRTPTKALAELGGTLSSQSVVTGYILRMLARRVHALGWEEVVRQVDTEFRNHVESALMWMDGDGSATRQAETAADLSIGLTLLEWAIEELGMLDEFSDTLSDMRLDLYQAAHEGYTSARNIVLGKQFMFDLRSSLRAHQCHIAAFGVAGPPMSSDKGQWHNQADFINDMLGWEPGQDGNPPKPGGTRVGDLVYDSQDRPCVVFDVKAAFTVVQRNHSGWKSHSANEVWDSAVVHGYRHEAEDGGWKPKVSGGGAGLYQRITKDGRQVQGVAVLLSKLLDVRLDADDADDEEAA